MIYAIGNSHAHFFSGSAPGDGLGTVKNQFFTSLSLGPTIAYNFHEHHLPRMLDILRSDLIRTWTGEAFDMEKDAVLLVIGEVDCRWHLPFQAAKQSTDALLLTRECIDRFFRTHLHLRDLGYRAISWGGHPSTTAGHNDDPSCPVYGDCQYRNRISKTWSDYMKSKSEEHGIPNVTIIDDLIDDDGLTKMQYYSDYCHLKSEELLIYTANKFIGQSLIDSPLLH